MRQGKYFGLDHPVTYLMMSIEYQNRGMPHAHIVFQLGNMPAFADKDELINWIDENISAEIPEDATLADLVKTHMTHKCFRGDNGCLDKNNVCKRGYDRHGIKDRSSFNDMGFADYRRRQPDDLTIVSYNKCILQD